MSSTIDPKNTPATDAPESPESPARKAMPELDAAKAAKAPAAKKNGNGNGAAAKKSTAAKKTTAAKKPAAKKTTAAKPAAKKENATTATAPAKVEFEWPKKPRELLTDYLTENISDAADAPNAGLPFITEGGILRVRGEHWRNWLTAKDINPPKLEASQVFRDLGFAMKPFALPGEERSHGFYTGHAPKGTERMPRRVIARAAATPKNPFAKLSAGQLDVLGKALAKFTGSIADKAIRDELAARVNDAKA